MDPPYIPEKEYNRRIRGCQQKYLYVTLMYGETKKSGGILLF
jgi:hypothetical protein